VLSAADASQLPNDPVPHVAMIGRSNVGKSTLINALVQKQMARTSATPGKTRLLNAYRIRPANFPQFLLVDLPGYGYAGRRGDSGFDKLVSGYFDARRERQEHTVALLLVDARHPGLSGDLAAWDWLGTAGVVPAVVVTKLDKLSGAVRARQLRQFSDTFDAPLAAVSAERGEGLDTLWTLIRKLLNP
jgi:GTP-binding protein